MQNGDRLFYNEIIEAHIFHSIFQQLCILLKKIPADGRKSLHWPTAVFDTAGFGQCFEAQLQFVVGYC